MTGDRVWCASVRGGKGENNECVRCEACYLQRSETFRLFFGCSSRPSTLDLGVGPTCVRKVPRVGCESLVSLEFEYNLRRTFALK